MCAQVWSRVQQRYRIRPPGSHGETGQVRQVQRNEFEQIQVHRTWH